MGKGGGPKAMKAPVRRKPRCAPLKEPPKEPEAGAKPQTGAMAEPILAVVAVSEPEPAIVGGSAPEKAEALAAVDSMRSAVTQLQMQTSTSTMSSQMMIAGDHMQTAVDALKLVNASAENVESVKQVNAALTAMNSCLLALSEAMKTANALNRLTFEQPAAPAAGPAAGCKRPASEMASTAGSAGAEKRAARPPRRHRK